MTNDPAFDVVVLGAGAGGLAAACSAAARGLHVLLLEKTACVGGTAAISGGMVWVPSDPAARTYLDATLSAGVRPELIDAFLRNGPEAIAWLEAKTQLRLKPVPRYPDYYPSLPGATQSGRVLFRSTDTKTGRNLSISLYQGRLSADVKEITRDGDI